MDRTCRRVCTLVTEVKEGLTGFSCLVDGLFLWLDSFLFLCSFPGATGTHDPLWRSIPADPLGGGIGEDN